VELALILPLLQRGATGIGWRQRVRFATLPSEAIMKPETEVTRNIASAIGVRNPFGLMDVPGPNDREVAQFADSATLEGSEDDDNASAWATAGSGERHDTIEGDWSSRWNGVADPTIPGYAAHKWKQGRAEAKITDERMYLLFDWDNGARRGLIDAKRTGPRRLVGKYINLSNPAITRPWIGLIVSDQRIDGRWPQGRLDFRR
jgi:hypothetical protein